MRVSIACFVYTSFILINRVKYTFLLLHNPLSGHTWGFEYDIPTQSLLTDWTDNLMEKGILNSILSLSSIIKVFSINYFTLYKSQIFPKKILYISLFTSSSSVHLIVYKIEMIPRWVITLMLWYLQVIDTIHLLVNSINLHCGNQTLFFAFAAQLDEIDEDKEIDMLMTNKAIGTRKHRLQVCLPLFHILLYYV